MQLVICIGGDDLLRLTMMWLEEGLCGDLLVLPNRYQKKIRVHVITISKIVISCVPLRWGPQCYACILENYKSQFHSILLSFHNLWFHPLNNSLYFKFFMVTHLFHVKCWASDQSWWQRETQGTDGNHPPLSLFPFFFTFLCVFMHLAAN